MKICRRLLDLFSFPGFIARAVFKEVADDSNVRVVTLRRQLFHGLKAIMEKNYKVY